jgi:hypothetical protein
MIVIAKSSVYKIRKVQSKSLKEPYYIVMLPKKMVEDLNLEGEEVMFVYDENERSIEIVLLSEVYKKIKEEFRHKT